eukprot:gene613-762_t
MEHGQIGDYVFQSRIGSGAFAQVFRAYHKTKGTIFAIKIVDLYRLTEKNSKLKENLNYEIKILKSVSHPNIVTLYDVIEPPPPQSDSFIYMVMECCEGGDFSKYIRKHKKLTEERALFFMRQLASGLRFLRMKDVIHRDLKPQNLLLSDSSDNPVLKIADFGFAKFIDVQSLSDTFCGSPLYMAPEILNRKNYTVKADLWSVGVILYEMLVGEPPFNCSTVIELLQLLETKVVTVPSNIPVSKDCLNLLYSLLQTNEMKRISWEDFFLHPWLGFTPTPSSSSSSSSAPSTTGNLPFNTPLPPQSSSIPIFNNNNNNPLMNHYNFNSNNNNFNLSPTGNNTVPLPPAYSSSLENLPFSFTNNSNHSTGSNGGQTKTILSPSSSVLDRVFNKSKSFTENSGSPGTIRAPTNYPFKDEPIGNKKNTIATTTATGTGNANPGVSLLSLSFEKDCVILDDEEVINSIERISKRAIAIAELGDLRQFEPAESIQLYIKSLSLMKSNLTLNPQSQSFGSPNLYRFNIILEKLKSFYKEYLVKTIRIYSTLPLDNISNSTTNLSNSTTPPQPSTTITTPSSTFSPNQYIYESALEMGRRGAVDEMYKNYSKSLQLYTDGQLLLEYLQSIATDKDDQDILKRFLDFQPDLPGNGIITPFLQNMPLKLNFKFNDTINANVKVTVLDNNNVEIIKLQSLQISDLIAGYYTYDLFSPQLLKFKSPLKVQVVSTDPVNTLIENPNFAPPLEYQSIPYRNSIVDGSFSSFNDESGYGTTDKYYCKSYAVFTSNNDFYSKFRALGYDTYYMSGDKSNAKFFVEYTQITESQVYDIKSLTGFIKNENPTSTCKLPPTNTGTSFTLKYHHRDPIIFTNFYTAYKIAEYSILPAGHSAIVQKQPVPIKTLVPDFRSYPGIIDAIPAGVFTAKVGNDTFPISPNGPTPPDISTINFIIKPSPNATGLKVPWTDVNGKKFFDNSLLLSISTTLLETDIKNISYIKYTTTGFQWIDKQIRTKYHAYLKIPLEPKPTLLSIEVLTVTGVDQIITFPFDITYESNFYINQTYSVSEDRSQILMSHTIGNVPLFYRPAMALQMNTPVYTSPATFYYYEFPYGFSGFMNYLGFNSSIPILPDSPLMTYNIYNTMSPISNVVDIPGGNDKEIDLLNPSIRVNFSDKDFSKLSNGFIDFQYKDTMGLGQTTCFLQWGPQHIPVKSEYLIAGDYYDGRYYLPYTFNNIYCSIPIFAKCSDIRGNIITIGSQSLLSSEFFNVDPSKSPQCQGDGKRLIHTSYSFNDNVNVEFSIAIGGVKTADNISEPKITLYTDALNTQVYKTLDLMQLIPGSVNDSIFSFKVIAQLETTVVKKLYIGVQFKIANEPLYRYSTADIDYFKTITKSTSMMASKSSLTIYPPGYKPVEILTISRMATDSGFRVEVDEPSKVSSLVIVAKAKEKPWPQRYVWNQQSPPIDAAINIDSDAFNQYSYTHFFIEQLCDIYGGCDDFPMYGYYGANIKTTPAVTPNVISKLEMTFSPTTIDATSNQRSITFSISLETTKTLDLSESSLPILYLTERYSRDQHNCTLISPRGGQLTCTTELPLNWGSRGVDFSIWNIVDTDGYITGSKSISTPTPLTINKPDRPYLFESVLVYKETQISVKGSNLGRIVSVKVNENQASIFSLLSASEGNISIEGMSIDYTKPLYIILNDDVNTKYPVNFIACPGLDCNGNGKCLIDRCDCNPGWSGNDCSIDDNYQCPEQCNNRGECISKVCFCETGWTGPSCKEQVQNNGNVGGGDNNPSAVFDRFNGSLSSDSKGTTFVITLKSMVELDYQGQTIKSFDLTKYWVRQNNNTEYFEYRYTNISDQNDAKLLVSLQIYRESGTFTWANQSFTIPANSAKYSIELSNYKFTTTLNKVKFTWETTTSAPNKCGGNEPIEIGGTEDDMHTIQLPQNQLSLYGRFHNKVIVDKRILSNSNQASQSADGTVSLSVSVPPGKEILIDPDFSVLTRIDQKSSNTCGSKSRVWLTAVIVVASVVGASLIIAGLAYALRNNYKFRMFLRTFKRKSSSDMKLGEINGNNNGSSSDLNHSQNNISLSSSNIKLNSSNNNL